MIVNTLTVWQLKSSWEMSRQTAPIQVVQTILKNQSAANSTADERNACFANITARRHCRRWGRYVSSDTVTVMTQFWAVELIPAAGRSGQATLKRRAPLAQTLKRSIHCSYHAYARGARAYYILYFNWPAAQLYAATVRQYACARTHNNNNNSQYNIILKYILCVHCNQHIIKCNYIHCNRI